MRFSKLRLNGFKSFVDPTDLIIGDGLTGVVGPNGCGKSNLLEALRWVMGENRPSAMRGGGMEDVIFAGAATRPARNFAEVSLVIDNRERLAPAGFNEQDSLEVIRRITRDVGSAYKTNGKDVRARDVQMLFADASTGAHSPSLVRQGQISELINAKPKSRRRILEEAAGISGLYQRRHEAELKLKGAETNLARVDDVLEQLATQLATLARQARQAARYREIGTQLRRAEGLLLYGRWQEADTHRLTSETELGDATLATARAEGVARDAEAARKTAEDALPPLREEDAIAAAIVQRLLVERDALQEKEARAQQEIDTLEAQIDQLSRDREREDTLNHDAGETIARLRQERSELEADAEGHDERLTHASDEARAAAQVLQDREADQADATEDVARLAARHQSAQRLVQDTQKTLQRTSDQVEKATSAVTEIAATLEHANTAKAGAAALVETCTLAAREAEASLTSVEAARADAQSAEADARADRSRVEGELQALQAEATALEKLMARDQSDAGQVMDDVRIEPGLEAALGAALGDDLRAPVAGPGKTGWHSLERAAEGPSLPAGVQPLTDFVGGADVLDRRLCQTGLVDRAEGDRLHNSLAVGQRLVSREGDLWRWDGFFSAAADAPSTAALRLQQKNRLSALLGEVDVAQKDAAKAVQNHTVLQDRVSDLAAQDKAARARRRDADATLTDATRRLNKAEADAQLSEGRLETLTLSAARHDEDLLAAKAALKEAEGGLADLGDLDAARAALEDIKVAVDAARMTMLSKRATHDELRRVGETRTARLAEITKETDNWTRRLETASRRTEELETRRTEVETALSEAREQPALIAAQKASMAEQIQKAEARQAASADALSAAEGGLRSCETSEREAERAASDARENRARAQARAEAAREAVASAADRIQEAMEVGPEALLSQIDAVPDQIPQASLLETDVDRLKRQRDALGAVNLRAEEDAREVQTEHDTLQSEKADLEEAIGKLRTGINSLNREGRERLLTAFEQVNDNFSMLFRHLFGGGEAKLVLVESDDPLEAGLEIMCQPPGKKLSTLSLLSGGEQTLTALALIFAVFLANPAPICVLDEVDAPLDDANVTRFCDLLDEMTRRTQTRFLMITHHAVTMSRMDRLFGVTMGEQGVSQLVSVDLKNAETLVA